MSCSHEGCSALAQVRSRRGGCGRRRRCSLLGVDRGAVDSPSIASEPTCPADHDPLASCSTRYVCSSSHPRFPPQTMAWCTVATFAKGCSLCNRMYPHVCFRATFILGRNPTCEQDDKQDQSRLPTPVKRPPKSLPNPNLGQWHLLAPSPLVICALCFIAIWWDLSTLTFRETVDFPFNRQGFQLLAELVATMVVVGTHFTFVLIVV